MDVATLSIVIDQAAGSARVVIHGGGTDVVAAVKVELTEPAKDAPRSGIVEADVEAFVPIAASSQRRAAIDIGQELTANLNALLNAPGAMDLQALCVVPGQLVWHVYVDVIIMEAGGSLMDACALAACAALSSAEIPRLRLIKGGEDGSRIDVDLDHDDPGTGVALPTGGVPVHVTFADIAGFTVVDTSVEEETVASERVRVGINRAGDVCLLATDAGGGGEGGIAPQQLHVAMEAAKGISSKLFAQVDAAVTAKRVEASGAVSARTFLSRHQIGPVLVNDSLQVMLPDSIASR